MIRWAVVAVLALALLACANSSRRPAPTSTLAGFVLPSRRAAFDEATLRVQRFLAHAARQLPGRVVALPADGDPQRIGAGLARARELELTGALDEAASTYDVALEAAARSPAHVPDRVQLVAATLARVSIAIARDEQARADVLLERLLRYDPGLALASDEDRPSLREAVERVRSRLGAVPALDRRDLGRTCDVSVDVLVVGRVLAGTQIELARVDACRPVATFAVASTTTDEAIARALLPLDGGAPGDEPERRRLYTRPWFIAVVAGVAITGVVAASVILARDRGIDVVPHW